jgi:NAD(P)-dependent dehydrogenase (short-subunit alcohol dehydrogenase family)
VEQIIMGKYAVTGAASGIGAAIVAKLKSQGHQIVTVDLRNADINVDLSTAEGRQSAIDGILNAAPEGLDGFVPCAGVGPQVNPIGLITKINYFGTVALVEALKDNLAKKRGAIVLISSNSATMSEYDAAYLKALAANDEAGAVEIIGKLDGQTAYGGSKFAVACWMRKNNADYARLGIRVNAIAPGYTETALTKESIPVGRPGLPEDQANATAFLLSQEASFISGVVLFVDGGHDAFFRPSNF